MRKTLVAATTAAALSLGALSAAPTVAAQDQVEGSAVTNGIAQAFDPEVASSGSFTDVVFGQYADMSSGNIEQSSRGVTRAIINYFIIFAGITVIGQIIQLIMKNLPR